MPTAIALRGGLTIGPIAMIGAGIAFCMSRLLLHESFHGKARLDHRAEGAPVHPHESGPWRRSDDHLAIGASSGGALSVGKHLSLSGWSPDRPCTVIPSSMSTSFRATLALVILGAVVAWIEVRRDEVPTSLQVP